MLVLGVDPGLATTGYGLVRKVEGQLQAVAYGVVKTPARRPLPARLQQLYRELSALIEQHGPDEGAVEELFFSRNVKTAMSVGQARGVALLALADAGLVVAEYTPLAVKQAVSGFGGADKRQMQTMVKMLLNLERIPRPDDAADALAVAVCHIHSIRLNQVIREGQSGASHAPITLVGGSSGS
jgi:crossover junction endodeoxyribonuclease RuvC